MRRDGGQERRRHRRAPILGTATVRWARLHEATYLVANLSAGGAQLFGTRPIPVGTSVEVVLDLGRRRAYRVEASVSRLNVRSDEDVDVAITFASTVSDVADAVESDASGALDDARDDMKCAIVVVPSEEERHMLSGHLHTHGRATFAVATPAEAAGYVSHPRARIDVAIVTLAEHCAKGIELLTSIAEHHPNARRIVLVADEDLARARELAGDCSLLRKPCSLPELSRALGD